MEKIIILGTAHLSVTPGKQSPNGNFHEAVYSREIVSDLKAIFSAYGFTVYVDYEPLEPCAQMNGADAKTVQSRELQYRVSFVNSICDTYGKENCIYISVHVNASGSDGKWHDARGWSVYTSPGKTESDTIATHIWNAASRNIPKTHKHAVRADWSDDDPDFESKLYVLMKTKCPAVLTENMFQDNRDDVDFLLSDLGYFAIERTHIEGVLTYFNSLKG